jgi:hypothetical protein
MKQEMSSEKFFFPLFRYSGMGMPTEFIPVFPIAHNA